MMAISRWRPARTEMNPMWGPMSKMMDQFFDSDRSDLMVWGPNVDVLENPESFEIHAELPGVKLEDVHITLDNNVLSISGEKKQEVKEGHDNFHRVERSYGRFERSFSLPATIKADAVKANFEDGVLKILLPKAEEAKSREIRIETTPSSHK